MHKNDKIIVAFLVSLGLFSTGQATQYVSGLSAKDKQILSVAADDGNGTQTDPKFIMVGDH